MKKMTLTKKYGMSWKIWNKILQYHHGDLKVTLFDYINVAQDLASVYKNKINTVLFI